MKKSVRLLFTITFLVAFFLSPGMILSAQETSVINIDEAAICKEVVERQTVDVGTSFTADVGKLFCFSKVSGVNPPVELTHVWYFGETERGRVALPVKAASWRTFSSKIIQVHEVGNWRVDILDPDGNVLKTVEFDITQ